MYHKQIYQRRLPMSTATYNSTGPVVIGTCQESELTELVRGQERILLEHYFPLVNRQSLVLDLGQVERIDAAGIAALVALYRAAGEAGNRFMVSNVTPRVAEVLILVGLDRILLSRSAAYGSRSGSRFERPAA
jgi:anti-anti-sigma factor